MNMSNPFYNVGPISDPKLFFNRKAGIETLLNNLFSGKPACLSIVGQRKIGKTSLVQHLSRATTIREFGFAESKYLFICFNCQKYPQALRSYDRFYQALLDRLFHEVPEQLEDTALTTLASSYDAKVIEVWDSVLQELWEHGYYLIVIFDEFDKAIIQETLIKEGLFGSLRGYASDTPNFAWITCTNRFLHILFEEAFDEYKITRAQRIGESDFYNLAPPYVVGLFEETDIYKLIMSPLESRGMTFSAEDIDVIIRCGGRFPYFIQRACHHFFNAYRAGYVQHESIIQEYIRDAMPIWEGFWHKLDNNHQMILFSIASGQMTQTSIYELNSLKDTALVYEQDGRLYPFSEEFGRFVLSRKRPRGEFIVQMEQYIGGRYRVLEVVGVTDHSQVVEAWDEKLKRKVAIKFVRFGQQPNDEDVRQLRNRLEREARILAQLKHPSIGAVYDVLPDPLGIVIEWVEGSSLRDLLKEHKQFSEIDVVTIGKELADALSYIHEHGVVHRDIKPTNIIVTESGNPILIDFDIARANDQQTISLLEDGSRGYIGTKKYSAPEQLLTSENVDAPSDLFALGLVLYQLLTSKSPYEYGNLPSLYDDHFPMPEQFNISEPLYQILCKLLSEKPDQRPDAATLREELQDCLNLL